MVEITDTEALKAHQKDIELLVEMEEGLPDRVEGDPIRLKQILRNLTNNAVKFTETGEVSVELKKVEENKNNITIQFSVSDTGIGLTQEQIEGLFAPFQQADISITRKYGGSGLGLAISKRIVELMDGQIWVESELGKGSTFNFTIPFKKLPPKKKVDLFTSKEVIGKKVLIVDSNIKSYQWLARLLKPTQADLTYVADIQTLEEILTQENGKKQFQVVLINNNVQGFRRLDDLIGLKNRLSSKAKVIHLTDTVQFAKRIQESGSESVDAVLIKPINASQLYDTWITLFKGKKVSGTESESDLKEMQVSNILDDINILLVEDNEINQDVIKELLTHAGARITIAENGAATLDLFKQNSFDLVLMDIQMPIMDGFSATAALRKDRKLDSLPIIALTANAQVEEKKKALKTGMNDYITKPIEPDLLFNTINKWVGKETIEVKSVLQETGSKPMPEIRGINTSKGLQRLNNDVKAYIALLEKFVKNHARDISHTKQFITKENWEKARTTIHAERGAAANLGAEALASSLGKIEASIKAKDPNTGLKEIKQATKLFKEIKSGIQSLKFDPVIEKTKQVQRLSTKELMDKLNELEEMIEEKDPESKVIINEIIKSNPNNKYNEILSSVQNFLDAYDFENAGTTTREIIEMLLGEDNEK